MNRIRFLVMVLSMGLVTCIDEVQIPSRSVDPRLVVEGLITNENTPYAVKLTYTGEYNSSIYGQAEIPVSGALVTITEVGGKTVTLEQDPVTPVYYWTQDSDFVGKVGKTYQLKIQLADGQTYLSETELLKDVPQIDHLYAEYKRRADTEVFKPDHYEVLLDTHDPAETGNYYRWSGYSYVPRLSTGEPIGFGFCCNYCWIPEYGAPSNVMADALVNGNEISRKSVLSSPIYYPGRHYVEISQYSLSRAAYQFWIKFEEQRTRNGSLFDPLPSSIEGNIHEDSNPEKYALGFFGASAVSKQKLIIPGDTVNLERLNIRYSDIFIKKGNCQLVYSQGNMNPPKDW